MAKKEPRGLELAMYLEDEADHMLITGSTGPMIEGILRQYVTQIREAPDFGAQITQSMWNKEVKALMMDLQASLAFMEARLHRRGTR